MSLERRRELGRQGRDERVENVIAEAVEIKRHPSTMPSWRISDSLKECVELIRSLHTDLKGWESDGV